MTNIDEKADRELVRLIAEKLMGRRGAPGWFTTFYDTDDEPVSFSPLTSAADSKQVRDKLAELGWRWLLEFHEEGILCYAFRPEYPDDEVEFVSADEFRAVAEVARKVVERG